MNKTYPYYEHKKIKNLKELLLYRLEQNENNTAFFYNENKQIVYKTYKDFYNDIKKTSKYLNYYYKNKHIGIIGENSYRWLVLFFSVILSGNTAVIIDKDLDEPDILRLLNKSDTNIIYYSKKYYDTFEYKNIESNIIESIDNYNINHENEYVIDENKDAVIFFTSGTTGPNKGVVLSEKNIVADIYGASSLFKLEGNVFSVLPFHHAFGLITSVLKPFYYGYPVFINSSLKYMMNELKICKPNTMFVVPAFIETFYKQIWSTIRKENKVNKLKRTIKVSNMSLKIGIDLRNKLFKSINDTFGGELKYIICGGAYLDKKYVKWFRNIGIEILNGYGITECSPVVAVNRNNYHLDDSVGQVCRNTEVKIVNGEITVKSDIVMKGYYNDKKATSTVLKDGYFYTGDLGYLDSNGFLFITGRIKDLIILSNGENISPEAIEQVLLNDDGVMEAVVYEKNNQILASIYPAEEYIGDQEYFDNLINKYNKNVPKNHQISLVTLRTKEFIKNDNKKILRNRIED